MIINSNNLDALFIGYKTAFDQAFSGAATAYKDIAMAVASVTAEETYGWLGQFPKVREWLGDRIIENLAAHTWTIRNRDFESTISVPRNSIEDDKIGVFTPMFREMGKAAAEHPDDLIFGLLKAGFTTVCYDGQNFFDTDHAVLNALGEPVSVSNMQAGAGPAWFLLDTSRAIKPMIYQERRRFDLVRLDKPEDPNVFLRKEYIYGVDGRSNVGFGLWQLAFASKAELTPENYEDARARMQNLKGDSDRLLGVKPTVLVVPPALEGAAMRLLNNGSRVITAGGSTFAVQNEWKDTAKPIVTAWAA